MNHLSLIGVWGLALCLSVVPVSSAQSPEIEEDTLSERPVEAQDVETQEIETPQTEDVEVSENHSEPEVTSKDEPAVETEIVADIDVQTDVDAATEAKSEPEAEAEAEAEPEPEPELELEPESQSEETSSVSEESTEKAYSGFGECEIVLTEALGDGATLASYRPADDFLDSVYDDEDGFMHSVGDLKIRAIMCTREHVMPTLRDLPIAATGLQFSISNDFESAESRLITIYSYEGEYKYKYSGETLSFAQDLMLKDRIDVYNLQPNDLDNETTP